MINSYRTWDEYHKQHLTDQSYAQLYLESALEEFQQSHRTGDFLEALRNVAESQGGVDRLAQRTALPPDSLLSILWGERTPKLDVLDSILTGLGFRLAVEPIPAGTAAKAA